MQWDKFMNQLLKTKETTKLISAVGFSVFMTMCELTFIVFIFIEFVKMLIHEWRVPWH